MNWFQFLYKSFYQLRTIAYSRFRPITKALLHVVIVMFIASLPAMITTSVSLEKTINQFYFITESDLPDFELVNGQLFTENQDSYKSRELIEGVFVLDPTNDSSLFDPTADQGIVLREREVLLFNYGETQSIPYAFLGQETMNKSELLERLADLQSFLPVFIIVISLFLFISMLGSAYLGITLLAAIGLLFRGKRKQLLYRHLWVMSAHAITMPAILFLWLEVLSQSIPVFLLLVAALIMLVLSIRIIPIPKQKRA